VAPASLDAVDVDAVCEGERCNLFHHAHRLTGALRKPRCSLRNIALEVGLITWDGMKHIRLRSTALTSESAFPATVVSVAARTITFEDASGVSRRYNANQVDAVEFTPASRRNAVVNAAHVHAQ
jgi:hypothetical protein